jgi:hypothetical protein
MQVLGFFRDFSRAFPQIFGIYKDSKVFVTVSEILKDF